MDCGGTVRKGCSLALLTYFIHAELVTRHLMCQGDTPVQVGRALRGHQPLEAVLYGRGSARDPGSQADTEISWAGVDLQAAERLHKYLPLSCGHLRGLLREGKVLVQR